MVGTTMRSRLHGWLGRALLVVVPVLLIGAAPAAQAAEKTLQRAARASADGGAVDDDGAARVIVKYRSGSSLGQASRGAARLSGRLQLSLEDGHLLGPRSQSLRGRGISAQALAARLSAEPDVEWAQPVRRKTVRAGLPNDPLFADNQATATPAVGQWFLRAPDATIVSAVNAVGAWAITPGSAGITVAVLDTGVRFDHPDLAGKLWPGYDFVSHAANINDGDGRDADASDPGDWSTATDSCGAANSSWHGTQVAGLVGAATDNNLGVAGVGRNTMVLPVRVLGRCGGFDDDIIAGMRWAGGLSNAAGCTLASTPTATCNPHVARVINLSLGSTGTCSVAYRDAIAALNAAGVVVVVASGNDTGHAVNEPANCAGALAVAGLRHAGTKVGYSNLGPQIAIAAPAGNCVNTTGECLYPLVTTLNTGTTSPGASTYSNGTDPSLGTSFATPIVAASAALLLAVNPALTPAQVKAVLQNTARRFPTVGAQESNTTVCQAPSTVDQVECYCTTTTCGAGILDAGAAVAQVAGQVIPPSAVSTFSTGSPTVGAPLTLESISSSRSVTITQWTVTRGAPLTRFVSSSTGATATLEPVAAGDFTVSLTATDAFGASSTVEHAFTAVDPPTVRILAPSAPPTVGSSFMLVSGPVAFGGRTPTGGFKWEIVSGAGVAAISGAPDEPNVTLTAKAAGSVDVRLTVTDSAGGVGSATTTVTVAAAEVVVVTPPTNPAASTPTTGGGGGGAVGGAWVLGLIAAALLLCRTGPSARGARR